VAATGFPGKVENGKLMLDNRQAFGAMVGRLEGKRVVVQIGKQVNKRSLPQNSFYFGIVLKTLGDHVGYTTDEMHDLMKFKFLCVDPDATLKKWKSTTKLSTIEFNEYLEKISQFAAELGCYIPDPNEAVAA
jgi:hypothetical protein